MPLSPSDRIAFSAEIVGAASKIAGISQAQTTLQAQIDKLQALDDGNKNLFDPVNVVINGYQNEFNYIDGNVRTVILEQDIQDAANRKLQNHFFPNDTSVSVPSLSTLHNVWPRIPPFALTYAIGKNYTEGYGSTPNENNLITTALGYITAAGSQTDMENTTGQHCVPVDTVISFPTVQTLKSDLVTAINSLKTTLLSEVAAVTTNDQDSGRQTQNNAAINNINNVIIPALNTWLGYADFNTSHGQTTCAGFNSYNSNLLAPTKLHSTQLAALQSALNARASFLITRTSQLNTNLGTIVQDINTGEIISSSGFYGQRYGFLSLRLNALGGSLTQLANMKSAISAQNSIKANIASNASIYYSILPTSSFKAPANATAIVHLNDVSFLSTGNTVFVVADNQEELQRAVKSISGNMVTLNDVIPSKYTTAANVRLYKDLT